MILRLLKKSLFMIKVKYSFIKKVKKFRSVKEFKRFYGLKSNSLFLWNIIVLMLKEIRIANEARLTS